MEFNINKEGFDSPWNPWEIKSWTNLLDNTHYYDIWAPGVGTLVEKIKNEDVAKYIVNCVNNEKQLAYQAEMEKWKSEAEEDKDESKT